MVFIGVSHRTNHVHGIKILCDQTVLFVYTFHSGYFSVQGINPVYTNNLAAMPGGLMLHDNVCALRRMTCLDSAVGC